MVFLASDRASNVNEHGPISVTFSQQGHSSKGTSTTEKESIRLVLWNETNSPIACSKTKHRGYSIPSPILLRVSFLRTVYIYVRSKKSNWIAFLRNGKKMFHTDISSNFKWWLFRFIRWHYRLQWNYLSFKWSDTFSRWLTWAPRTAKCAHMNTWQWRDRWRRPRGPWWGPEARESTSPRRSRAGRGNCERPTSQAWAFPIASRRKMASNPFWRRVAGRLLFQWAERKRGGGREGQGRREKRGVQ